jgi:hypothetical protein
MSVIGRATEAPQIHESTVPRLHEGCGCDRLIERRMTYLCAGEVSRRAERSWLIRGLKMAERSGEEGEGEGEGETKRGSERAWRRMLCETIYLHWCT